MRSYEGAAFFVDKYHNEILKVTLKVTSKTRRRVSKKPALAFVKADQRETFSEDRMLFFFRTGEQN